MPNTILVATDSVTVVFVADGIVIFYLFVVVVVDQLYINILPFILLSPLYHPGYYFSLSVLRY